MGTKESRRSLYYDYSKANKIAIRRKRTRQPLRQIKEDAHRINQKIRSEEVRLVGDNIEVGVYPIRKALAIAEEQELDLVEISPKAVPPFCKVMDYKKFLYEQKKRIAFLKHCENNFSKHSHNKLQFLD